MKNKDSKYCSCLYYSANAFARVMTKIAEEEFIITGLAPSYAFLLMTVNDSPGVNPKQISEQMQLTPSTVTRLIEKMEYKGLVRRKSIGRNTEVYPTSKSKKINDLLKASWRSLYARYTNLLGEDHAKQLTANIYDAFKKLDK